MAKEEKDKEIIDLIDKVILFCPEHTTLSIQTIIGEELNLPEKKHLANQVRAGMNNLGYIDVTLASGVLQQVVLTDFGKEVKRLGGHYNYIKWIENEEKKEQIKYDKEIRNLESSIRLNEWLYKTKWLPLILSIIALILSIIALYK